ncbi:R3H domain-containing protein 4-like [Thrips palmi]|uniref:R3H domain-containing protein 4-like n=1 Tax=Thrips palmi TaxID=161013 RepID=A0A6P8YFJ9_THRPL|nr:R3H domain-containing protein 4-like [Thrips palmi]
MGLISKEDPVKGLFNASSAESLHIPSEPPSEDELPPPVAPPVVHHSKGTKSRVPPIPTNFFRLRKVLGKKKSRRYQDSCTLMTLVEEDEFGEVSITDLVPHNDSQFAHLLKDNVSMAMWNEFIESSEEAQQCLLMQFGNRGKVQRKRDNKGEVLSGEDAFQNMDRNLRSFLRKSKVPLGLLSYLEERVTTFFVENPLEIFVSENMSSYERLMLHAISQYHQLLSHSVDTKGTSPGRFVKVINPHLDFRVPALSLGDYLGVTKDVLKCEA